eukprot:3335511-Alexandrium_andersonii.AAC.1
MKDPLRRARGRGFAIASGVPTPDVDGGRTSSEGRRCCPERCELQVWWLRWMSCFSSSLGLSGAVV